MKALYTRVSTAEQANEGYSIGEQIDRLKDYCSALGWKDYIVYSDGGYTGGNTDRPALQRLLEDVKAHKIDKVVVYKLDRLSRSQKDTLVLIEDVFLANNCDFVSISENFDTSTAFGKAMIGILAVFAQLEREQIKERTEIGREARAKAGYFHGGQPPIGYDLKNGLLAVNEYEALQIRELFERYLHGESLHELERSFDDKGYRTKRGKWSTTTMRRALKRATYCGYVTYAGEIHEGQHEAIIDKDTFDAVGAIVDGRKQDFLNQRRLHAKRSTALGGLIYCARCGARYGVQQGRNRKRFYSCYSRARTSKAMIKADSCDNKRWIVEELDALVFEQIRGLSLEPDALKGEGYSDPKEPQASDPIGAIQTEIQKLHQKRQRLLDLYAEGIYTTEELAEKAEPLKEQIEQLTQELNTLKERTSAAISEEKARELIESFGDILDRGQQEEVRLVLDELIERIELDGEDVAIYWKF